MLNQAIAEQDRVTMKGGDDTGSPASREVYELDPLSDPRWPALVTSHPQSSVFHTRMWLSALKATYGYRPLVLTTCPPQARLTNGIVFCEVRSWVTGRRLVSLPFSDHCEPLMDDPEALGAVLKFVRRGVELGRYKRMEVRPHSAPGDAVRGFQLKGGAVLHRLDLTAPTDELFRSFHKDCIQRKIRRAERENLVYEEGCSEAQLNDFYRLMTITRRRHGLPPQPVRWFKELIAAFGPSLKIRIARRDGAAVSSIVTISHRQTMVYKYGCSDERANKYGGTPMLFWHAIQDAKAHGQSELDMGRSDLENPGLSVFKEHWGSVPAPLTYWRYPETEKRPIERKRWTNQMISASPDWVLLLASNTLYRHMG